MTRPLLKTCSRLGCPGLTRNWLCEAHEAERRANANARRPSRHDTYDARWEKARKAQLAAYPECQCTDTSCKCGGTCSRQAEHADHIVPREQFATVAAAHDPLNLQSLCKPCHSSKTARHDGGFGRPTT